MIVKNKDLQRAETGGLDLLGGVVEVCQLELPAKMAYRFNKLQTKLAVIAKDLEKTRIDLVTPLIKKDEDGNSVPAADGKGVLLINDVEKVAEMNKQLDELLEEENEVEWEVLSVSEDLKLDTVKPDLLSKIDSLIKE